MTWINYPFYVVENAIDTAILNDLIFKANSLTLQDGQAGASRSSKIAWLDRPVFANIYTALENKIQEINNEFFKLDLDQLEPLQFSKYPAEGDSHYGWHTDIGTDYNVNRKLSFTLQLSTDSSYTGGDLEFFNGENAPVAVSRNFGALIVFPSTAWHRITDVTSGQRLSLAGWLNGPRFR